MLLKALLTLLTWALSFNLFLTVVFGELGFDQAIKSSGNWARILHAANRVEGRVSINSGSASSAVFGGVATEAVPIEQWTAQDSVGTLHFPFKRLPSIWLSASREKRADGYTIATLTTTQLCGHGWHLNREDYKPGTAWPHVSYLVRVDPREITSVDGEGLGPLGVHYGQLGDLNPNTFTQCLQVGEGRFNRLREYVGGRGLLSKLVTFSCPSVEKENCIRKEANQTSERTVRSLQSWANPESFSRWNRHAQTGILEEAHILPEAFRVGIDVPSDIWNRETWNISRVFVLSGAARRARRKSRGEVFCEDTSALPSTQISNPVNDRVTGVDIVLAYSAAFALVFVQLRSALADSLRCKGSLEVYGASDRDIFDIIDLEWGVEQPKKTRSTAIYSRRSKLMLLSLMTLLIAVAETLPVWLVFHMEKRASVWTGIAARVCSASLGWDLGSIRESGAEDFVLIGGYAASTMIKTSVYMHSRHAANGLLIGAILITFLIAFTATLEIWLAYRRLKEY